MAESIPAEERARVRRQVAEQSVKLAVAGRWEQAAALNRDLLERIGGDVEAYNRLGKALTELGRLDEAHEVYRSALQLEPGNSIARRNLDRLAQMREAAPPPAETGSGGRGRFIEESGKAARVAIQAVDDSRLAPLDAGDDVTLEVQGNAVNVLDQSGNYIGMLDPRVGLRLSKLMTGGNRYSAAMVSTSGTVQVMVRELFQHPSQLGKVSFPQGRVSEVRGYTRPNLVRRDDDFEPDIDDDQDDDAADDTDTERWGGDENDEVSLGSMSDDDDQDDEDDMD